MFKIQKQHVFITGASGGVGKVAVKRFLDEGCKVSAQVNSNLSSLIELDCPDLVVLQADVKSERAVIESFDLAVKRHGKVHILILNHGIFRAKDIAMANMTLAQWEDTLDVNLTGSFLFARSFLRQIEPESDIAPRICIVGSTAGKYGEAMHADYASSKSALQIGFTLSLKNEIVKHHARGRVNAVAPGWISTPMAEESMRDPETKYKALGTTPLRKIASADEVVDSILFLVSPLSSHTTGHCIMVEGGMEGRVLNRMQDVS
jgi:NAD(P)-dependent dehydrogenase (short-subunit alcohol dehydrogenase family)